MEWGLALRRHVPGKKFKIGWYGSAAKNNIGSYRIDFEASILGLHQYPLKGNLGEAGFAFRITPSHVGMETGEPHLTHVLNKSTRFS
jgi:hypothetical protein